VAFAALGHTNKLIAYELGLAVPTVAGHLRRAMDKLGLDSRSELIRVAGFAPPHRERVDAEASKGDGRASSS
jgi:DNA-binding NarL/FixJ family response regulator